MVFLLSYLFKCKGKSRTLKEKENSNIYGGYTETAWLNSSQFVKDPKAFIYSLVNHEGN